MIFTNVFQLKGFDSSVSATPVSLSGLPDDSQERYGAVQGIVSRPGFLVRILMRSRLREVEMPRWC